MSFTAQYKECLARHVPLFLREIMEADDARDLEFGVLAEGTVGTALEWHTDMAFNLVTRLFVLSMMNNDDERYVLFTRQSPIAALKYVGQFEYRDQHAFDADSGTLVPLHADDEVQAIVKKFSLFD